MVNKSKWKPFLAAAIFLISSSQIVGCDLGLFDTKDASVEPSVNKPAAFEVGPIVVTPYTIMAGDSVNVSTAVKNIGDESGIYTAILAINAREVAKKYVTIAPANSSTVGFQVADLPAGDHEIVVDGSSAKVAIHGWVPYTIKYCKGQADWTLFSGEPAKFRSTGDLGQIVHFTPPSVPFKIQKIKICGEAKAENQSELDVRQFTVSIWNKDRNQQLWSGDFPWRVFEESMSWREIAVPDIRVEDDFYVEMVTHSDTGNQASNYLNIAFELARDALPQPRSLEYYRKSAAEPHSGWSQNAQPFDPPGRKISINWCIRVDGEGKE